MSNFLQAFYFCLIISLSACGSIQKNDAAEYQQNSNSPKIHQQGLVKPRASAQNHGKIDISEPKIRQKLLSQLQNWQGVRYRLGGTSRNGIDCSGFVQRTFSEQFKLSLPRMTQDQVRTGKTVSRSKLRSGDLVFFKTGFARKRHVGIYVGYGDFIHASTSRGVMKSNLDNPYWKKAYWTSRRIKQIKP